MLRAFFFFFVFFCALSFARSLAHSVPKWAIRREREREEEGELGEGEVEGVAIDNKQP